MSDYVDRLTACGMNLIDAYEVVEDYLYDGDLEGLDEYVRATEQEDRARVSVL